MKLRNVLTVLGVLAFAATLATLVSRPLGAANGPPTTPVSIVSPLPVPVGPVSGTVAATQSGAPWSVNVSNTPTVGLASGASVLVGNPSSSPVRVHDVGEDQPIQASGSTGLDNFGGSKVIYSVPSGKRLVIEYASAACLGLSAGQSVLFTVATAMGGFIQRVDLTMPPPALGNSGLTSIGSTVRAYGDPSTDVTAEFARTDSGTTGGGCDARISGRLENAP